jgi:transposase
VVISVEIQEQIRRAKIRDGKSGRQIAEQLGISRNTVSKVLKQKGIQPPEYRRTAPKRFPVLGAFIPVIDAWLESDTQAPKKQRHTSKRIFDRLEAEYGFTGSERTVRQYVATARKKPKTVYLPLAFEPGEMAQADWIENMAVVIAGKPCKLPVFAMVLNHAGSVYCEAFPHMRQEALFEGHAHAFEFWKGVPKTVTYDNLKSAVEKVLVGKNRLENKAFVAFRGGYLFESRFCNPARGNEKGRVENMVKFIERNFLTPVPQVDSLAELNALLRQRCLDYHERVQARQTETIGARLATEQQHLLPLPRHLPECCRIVPVKANKSSLVQFETNRYSVPSEAAYQTLWLKAFVDRVEITDRENTLAVHPRLSGSFQESLNFDHYVRVLERKPGAEKHLRQRIYQEPARGPFPQVVVQEPNLRQYNQLHRNLHYDPSTGTFIGNPPQETQTAQYPQAVP